MAAFEPQFQGTACNLKKLIRGFTGPIVAILASLAYTTGGQAQAPTSTGASDNQFSEVAGKIATSRQQLGSEPNIENEIRLATWLLMFGEMTARDKDRGLWSTSLNAFHEGELLLAQVESSIDKDPTLEARVSKTPTIAMRLDAARVRQPRIAAEHALARKEEVARLGQLREIARAFQSALQDLEALHLAMLIGDEEQTKQLNTKVLGNLAGIQEIASSRKDYYLFNDEPVADAKGELDSVQTPVDPISQKAVSYVKSLQGLILFRLAVPNADQPADKKLLDEAITWATASISDAAALPGIPKGYDEKNLLGEYVLGMAYEMQGVQKTRKNPADSAVHRSAMNEFKKARTLPNGFKPCTSGC